MPPHTKNCSSQTSHPRVDFQIKWLMNEKGFIRRRRKRSHMIRSLLYVPASSSRFIAKAHQRGADAIILDLEDSVAPSEKEKARAGLAEAIPSVSRNGAK